MSANPTTLSELHERINRAFERFLEALENLSDAQRQEPHLPNGWSVKDVLGHLAWWDRWLVYTLYPDNPEIARRPPPLLGEIATGEHALDELNARVYEFNRSRSLSDIQTDFAEARQQVAQVVPTLSAEDVFGQTGRSALIGRPLAPLILGIYEHYEEHAHELEAQR